MTCSRVKFNFFYLLWPHSGYVSQPGVRTRDFWATRHVSSSCILWNFREQKTHRGVKTARGRCGSVHSSWFSLDSGRHCCHLLFIVVSAPLGGSFHGIHIQIVPGRRVLNATMISASLSAYFARH
jgi:hypothetical protein